MTTNKINFSALKTQNTKNKVEEKKDFFPPKTEENIKNIENTNKINIPLWNNKEEKIETKKEDNKPIIQISLWKKKDIISTEKENKTESKKEEENKIELETKKDENKKEEENKISENINKENKIEKNNIETIIKEENSEEKLIEKPEVLFSNYESDFNSKQDTIIERLKKLKHLPKTRPKLVLSMIWILIIWVSWIIYISPNDSLIKTSIIWVEQKKEQKITTINKNVKTDTKTKQENKKQDYEKIKKEKLTNFLLKKKNKHNQSPQNINIITKHKMKEKDLKKLLLEARNNK